MKKLFFSILLFMLSGCHLMQSEVIPEASYIQYDFPQEWAIHGRISIINDEENWYAKFIWIQKGEDFEIRFMGPLGETELQLTRIAHKTHLKTPSSERHSDNLQQLLLQETGWKFPANSLRYWSHGVPNPDQPNKIKYDEKGDISELDQGGWHIRYSKRMQLGEYVLPKKLIVTQQSLKIKIIISKWDLERQKEL